MTARYYEDLPYVQIDATNDGDDMERFACDIAYARVSVLPGTGKVLEKHGFRMIDRTLEVKIPLQKSTPDFEKKIRLPVERVTHVPGGILSLARRNFKDDSRFYVTDSAQRQELADGILKTWVDEIENPFICLYRDEVIGFADVRFLEEYHGNPFVYLAAVEEKYRLTGAALSLYAAVCMYYRGQGKQYLYGRISSKNTAVMNLYASLGGQFRNPWDIFVKN